MAYEGVYFGVDICVASQVIDIAVVVDVLQCDGDWAVEEQRVSAYCVSTDIRRLGWGLSLLSVLV